MNICFFGSYNKDYCRNKIFIDGLKKNKIKIFHCNSNSGTFIFRYPVLFWKFISVVKSIQIIFVSQVCQRDILLAWILSKLFSKKLVFDMFFSMYETYIFDRRSVKPESIQATIYYWFDKLSLLLVDLVITDTHSHAKYFSCLFNIQLSKFRIIYIGGDDSTFQLKNKNFKNNKLIIEFHGYFTRLSGAEYFIKAAKKLENYKNIEFWLIGESKVYLLPLKLLSELKPVNLKYFTSLDYADLAKKIIHADISVGHLGNTKKALNVISNKTFNGLAVGNAVIVINSSANRELLTNNQNAIFVKPGNVQDLIDAILKLYKNNRLLKNISKSGYKLHQSFLTNKIIGKNLLESISFDNS